MVNRPSQPEIITVNSEALQTQIRDLLPSQNGFGSELQASNVITPIIDLTATAEGSGLPANLQTALAFGSQTSYFCNNNTVVLENSPGFYRNYGTATVRGAGQITFNLSDGFSTKIIYNSVSIAGATYAVNYDFIVFLAPGESISAISNTTDVILAGSTRQVATGDGTLVQPNGFPL